jgi:NADH dehydrogenase
MIYGGEADRNISRLIRLIDRSGVVPLPGGGRTVFQPVHVNDLASCIVAALERPESIGRIYDIPGRDALTLAEIVRTIADLLGKPVLTVPVPLPLALFAVKTAGLLVPRLGISADQIERLGEDKAHDLTAAATDLGYDPAPFREGIKAQLQRMNMWRTEPSRDRTHPGTNS